MARVLREFEGRLYAEIARILGISTSALETLLFRARRSLAEELESVVTCARLVCAAEQSKRGLRRLAWLPLWFPFNLLRHGGHKALATAVVHAPEAALGASGGGLAIGGGIAAKVAAVVITAASRGRHRVRQFRPGQP